MSPPKDRQVAVSFTSNLLANSEKADEFAALFRALYLAVDEREISYDQGSLQLVASGNTAQGLQELLARMGVTVTVKEL